MGGGAQNAVAPGDDIQLRRLAALPQRQRLHAGGKLRQRGDRPRAPGTHLGGLHQRLQHTERMRLDNALARQAHAVAVEHLVEQRIETFLGIAHHPILLQQLMQRGAVRQRVAAPHHVRRFILQQRLAVKLLRRRRRRQRRDGEIHRALAQLRLGVGHQAFRQFQPHRRHLAAKRHHRRRQHRQHQPGSDRRLDQIRRTPAQRRHFALRLLQLVQHQPGVRQQGFAVGGKTQTGRRADQQRQRLFLLQFAQCAGHRRLRQPQMPRRRANAAAVGAGHQRLQLVQFHVHLLTIIGCQHNRTAATRQKWSLLVSMPIPSAPFPAHWPGPFCRRP